MKSSYLTILLLFIGVFLSNTLQSQIITTDSTENLGICDEDGLCRTRFSNSPRPKGISIIQQRYLDYEITTTVKGEETVYKEEVRRNRQTEFNLRFPIILKDQHNLIAGLEYVEENFDFFDPENLENEFHRELQVERFRLYQLKVYYNYKFKGPKFINTRTSFAFSGDLDGEDFKSREYWDYFQFTFSGLYNFRRSTTKIIGFGASLSYEFGERRVFPILYYNKQFNDKMGVELKLPAKAEFRYFYNKKNLFYAAVQAAGTSYVMDYRSQESDKSFFNTGNVLGLITYEKEIYDFFWITASIGYRANVIFDLSKEEEIIRNDDAYVESDLTSSPMIRFGIFIVPPRKMMNKM